MHKQKGFNIRAITKSSFVSEYAMFQVSDWTGIYERGKEILKIAFSAEKKEVLILYFTKSADNPPSLIR